MSERALRCCACALLVTYVAWQVLWISSGQFPPSLFLALTGWPAATSGGTRSILAMLSGDWRLSIYHNAMAVPMVVMSTITVTWLLRHPRSLRTSTLPWPIVAGWIAVLSIAWIIKLAQAIAS